MHARISSLNRWIVSLTNFAVLRSLIIGDFRAERIVALLRPSLSLSIDREAPHLQEPLGYVAAMAILFAPSPQSFRPRTSFIRETQFPHTLFEFGHCVRKRTHEGARSPIPFFVSGHDSVRFECDG